MNYYDIPRISASGLICLQNSANEYFAQYLDPNRDRKRTDAQLLGSLVHALILEPATVEAAYAVAPKVDRRTKDGKAEWDTFLASCIGKEPVPADMWDTAQRMAQAVVSHKKAASILARCPIRETPLLWTATTPDDAPVEVKSKPDAVGKKFVLDVKTTGDISDFERSAYLHGYHLQAAFYVDACRATYGDEERLFCFLVVQSKAPHTVALFAPDEDFIAAGRYAYKRALEKYVRCKESDTWDDYADVHSFGLPAWAHKEIENL